LIERAHLPDPTRIGDYLLLDRIGEGGAGVVYRARHASNGSVVAVKTAKYNRRGHLASLRREFWTLRRLRRRGVIELLDGGSFEGRPWYAMELLDGSTLAALLPGGALDTESTFVPDHGANRFVPELESPQPMRRRAFDATSTRRFLTLVRRVAETLAFLHGEGIVHRDIKPSNLFVRPDGTPVLMDFGLVRQYQVGGREVLDVSDAAGTAGYMAPEQALGERTDARADLYALGCIIYQCVVGQAPFWAANQVELLRLHAVVAPVPPRELLDGVPAALDDLIMRMLAKNPRDRVGYAADVAEALAALGAEGWSPPEPSPQRTAPYRPQVVGRAGTFAEIDRAVASLRGGRGAFFLVDGESGIGKTAFAAEVARTAAMHGVAIVTGECGQEALAGVAARVPLRPFQPFLRAVVDLCVTGDPEVAERLLGRYGRALALYEPELAAIPNPAGASDLPALPPEAARNAMLALLLEVLAAFAREKPLLLIVDDLQWCDDLSAVLLEMIAGDFCAQTPVVVVATCRSEEGTPAIERIRRARSTRALRLERLDRAELAEMVGDMLAVQEGLPDLATALWDVSAGNPFFVTEYLRAVIGERLLVREKAAWRTTGPGSFTQLPLPTSIHELIQRRLNGLDQDSTRVLEVAAVIGREMDLELLASAAAATDPTHIEQPIQRLVERQILEEATADRLRFVHDRVRVQAYRAIPVDTARRLHRAVAELLEQRANRTGDGEAESAVIGRHYAAAGIAGRAIPNLRQAADHARDVYANEDAIVLYDETLAQVQSATGGHQTEAAPIVAALSEAKADVLSLVGRRAEARASYELALIQSAPSERTSIARRLRKTGKTWEREHRYVEALELYSRAEESLGAKPAEDEDPEWWRAWLDVQIDRMWSYYWSAQLEPLERLIIAVGGLVDRWGSPAQRTGFYQSLTLYSARKERFRLSDRTVGYARAAMQAQQVAADRWQLPLVRFGLGFALLLHGDHVEAERELETGLREAERTGDQALIARFLSYLALLYRKTAAVDKACALAGRILAMQSSGQMSDYHAVAHATLGWAARSLGQTSEARRELALACDLWQRPPAVFPFQWLANAPLLAIAIDDTNFETAKTCIRRLLMPTQQRLPDEAEALANEALVSAGQNDTRIFAELAVVLRRECLL
jgi:tetratricopeptide (TPR) repeat protein